MDAELHGWVSTHGTAGHDICTNTIHERALYFSSTFFSFLNQCLRPPVSGEAFAFPLLLHSALSRDTIFRKKTSPFVCQRRNDNGKRETKMQCQINYNPAPFYSPPTPKQTIPTLSPLNNHHPHFHSTVEGTLPSPPLISPPFPKPQPYTTQRVESLQRGAKKILYKKRLITHYQLEIFCSCIIAPLLPFFPSFILSTSLYWRVHYTTRAVFPINQLF